MVNKLDKVLYTAHATSTGGRDGKSVAADGHLEWNAPEEAFGELRRAQVQVETLAWLARRIL